MWKYSNLLLKEGWEFIAIWYNAYFFSAKNGLYLSKNRFDSISWWAQAQIMFSSLAHTVKQYLIKWGIFHIIFISVINLFTTILQVKELFKSLNVTFYALEMDLLGNMNNTRKLIKQENWISIFITFLHSCYQRLSIIP